MPYIFQVSPDTVDDCIKHSLFGVPGTVRALAQLALVPAGERCYLHVPQGRKGILLGRWRAGKARWTEAPGEGSSLDGRPWADALRRHKGRVRSWLEVNYPYRMAATPDGPPRQALVALLEQAGVLDRSMFEAAAGMQGRPCVVYVTDRTADRMDARMQPRAAPFDRTRTHVYAPPDDPRPLEPIAEGARPEDLLAWRVIRHPDALARALEMDPRSWRVLDAYVSLTESASLAAAGHRGWAGEVDMVALGAAADVAMLVVIELKAAPVAPKSRTLAQLFGYWTVLRRQAGRMFPSAAVVLPVVGAPRFPATARGMERLLSPCAADPTVTREEIARFARTCLLVRVLEPEEAVGTLEAPLLEPDALAMQNLRRAATGRI